MDRAEVRQKTQDMVIKGKVKLRIRNKERKEGSSRIRIRRVKEEG